MPRSGLGPDIELVLPRAYHTRSKVPRDSLDKIAQYTYPDIAFPLKAATPELHATEAPATEAPDAPKEASVEESSDHVNSDPPGSGADNEPKKPEPVATGTGGATSSGAESREDEDYQHRLAISRSQSTCVICLDDFIGGESVVRELPCNHIYHSKCIDPFLTRNSSLCPLCKRDVLAVIHGVGGKSQDEHGRRGLRLPI